MLGSIPYDLSKISNENINKEILRIGLIAELDAVNLYEQLASMTDDQDVKKVFMDIAKEEKEHVGEFQYLLLKHDKQQEKELKEGMEEVQELLGEK